MILRKGGNMKFKKYNGHVKRYYCNYCGGPITYDDYIKYSGLCFLCIVNKKESAFKILLQYRQ